MVTIIIILIITGTFVCDKNHSLTRKTSAEEMAQLMGKSCAIAMRVAGSSPLGNHRIFPQRFFCLYKKCMSTLLSSFHPPHQSFRAQTALLLLLHHSPDQIYGRVQPISHNTLSRIIYAISCLFFKSFNVVHWKLGSYQ